MWVEVSIKMVMIIRIINTLEKCRDMVFRIANVFIVSLIKIIVGDKGLKVSYLNYLNVIRVYKKLFFKKKRRYGKC